jgi:hypothetical protein
LIVKSANAAGFTMTRWRFSLRSLLLMTTIMAVCLAFGVHYPRFTTFFVTLQLVWIVALMSAEWLIRPTNSRVQRLLTATIWAVLGSLFFAMSGREIYGLVAEAQYGSSAWAITICAAASGVVCCRMAWLRIHN